MAYLEMVTKDVENVIDDYDIEWTDLVPNIIEKLVDDLWADDAVTGNGCNGYCGIYEDTPLEQMVKENIDYVAWALDEFGGLEKLGKYILNGDYKHLDITARCCALYQAVSDVVEYNVRAMII